MEQETQTSAERLESYRRVPFLRRLSTKLLLLTVVFVVIAEILIFIPSVAAYRLRWLEEKLGTVAAVGSVLIQGGPGSLPRAVQDDVLEATPDFLEETPEHDRLWFEQKEPKDFDFGD